MERVKKGERTDSVCLCRLVEERRGEAEVPGLGSVQDHSYSNGA